MAHKTKCPGSLNIREPVPEYVDCPCCGEELEIWSDEARIRCDNCGQFYVSGAKQRCLDWCPHARECVGDKAYEDYLAKKQHAALGGSANA